MINKIIKFKTKINKQLKIKYKIITKKFKIKTYKILKMIKIMNRIKINKMMKIRIKNNK